MMKPDNMKSDPPSEGILHYFQYILDRYRANRKSPKWVGLERLARTWHEMSLSDGPSQQDVDALFEGIRQAWCGACGYHELIYQVTSWARANGYSVPYGVEEWCERQPRSAARGLVGWLMNEVRLWRTPFS